MDTPNIDLAEIITGFARSASPSDWERLVAATAEDLQRVTGRITGDAQTAADAVQDAWLRVRRDAARFRPRGGEPDREARAWLRQVATCCALDHVRSRSRRARRERNAPVPPPIDDPSAAIERAEIARLLRDELARLPAGQREAITLRFVVGLDVAAVAESLGVPEGTVKSHVHRGVERLRRRLARRSAAFAAVGVTTALARLPAVEGSVVAATAPSAIAVGASTTGMIIMASSLAAVSFAVVAAVAPLRSPAADGVPPTRPPGVSAPKSEPTTAVADAWDTQFSSTFDCTIGEALDRIAQRVGQRAPDPPRLIDRARHLELTVRSMRASDLVKTIHHLGRVGDDAAPRLGVVIDVQGGLAFFTYDAPPAPALTGAPAGAGYLARVAILGDGRGAHGTIAAVERGGVRAVVDVIAGSPRVGDVVVRLAHPDDIDPAVRDRLLQPATIEIKDAPLGSVVAFVQRLSAVNILVDPRLGQVPPVSVQLREQPLIHALDQLPCAWRWVDDAIQLDSLPSVVGEPWRPQPDGAAHADDF